MLQFVQPGWLWAALSAAIPVLIHLWNIREGKTLRIGSVLLLQQSARQHARSFRVREWLLLALRCLLIVLLCLLLAQPGWLSEKKAVQQRGWVLLEKSLRKELYTNFKKQIDSLAGAGLQLRYFENGFPAAKREELTVADGRTATNTAPYWTVLRQLYRQVPAELPLYLYTGNRLKRFTGERPALPLNLRWQVITPADSVSTWLASARLTPSDSVQVVKAVSRPLSTSFETHTIAATGAEQKGFILAAENGKLLASLSGTLPASPLEVDTSTLQVGVFTDTYMQDAVYLQAAIRAIRQYTHRRIRLQLINNPTGALPPLHWLFWLSDKPLPAVPDSHIFRYMAGKERQQHSWLLQKGMESSGEPIATYKCISDSSAARDEEMLWHDGYGQAVLTKTSASNKTIFNFYSRFNPQWNDLPWSSRFPVWLLPLLLDKQAREPADRDRRVIDRKQIVAVVPGVRANSQVSYPPEKTDLSKALWVAAFLVFFFERLVSYRNTKRPA